MDQSNHKCIISLVDSGNPSSNLSKVQYNSKSYESLSYQVKGTTGQLCHVVSSLCTTGLCGSSYGFYLKGPWKHMLLILIKQEVTVCVITWIVHMLITCSMTQLPGGKYQEATTWKMELPFNPISKTRNSRVQQHFLQPFQLLWNAAAIHFPLLLNQWGQNFPGQKP